MIDLHCHLLPGIDDGPDTLDDSLALASSAATAGTRTIVATPHVSWKYRNDAETIHHSVDHLAHALAAEQVGIEVLTGAEIAMTYVTDIPSEELGRLTLGGSAWLLIEPPFAPVATGLDAIVIDLMQQGYEIMIAHPERCAALHRDPSLVATLVRAGALTSVTAGSLNGRFGSSARRFALRMLEEGMAHNVASDAHDSLNRPPTIAECMEQAGLAGLREWLTEQVPAAMLAGERIPPRPSVSVPRGKGFLGRLRRG